jgi:NAD-dependent dihydropyrimidine dehydrogenase PreA subunit
MSFFHSRQSSTRFVQLNKKNCTACWSCVEECHKDVLDRIDVFGHRHAKIAHPELCAGCLKCVKACPSGAITAITTGEDVVAQAAVAKRRFNNRAFTALAMLMAALILPVSGIMNHRLQFDILTQERHFWMAVHNVAASLFVCFATLHIVLNWKALAHYARTAKAKLISREAIVAVGLVVFVVGLVASHAFHIR